jgi:hypothetical protein
MAHDRWAYFLGSTFGSTICLSQPLALYRQHEDSAFGSPGDLDLEVLRDRVQIAAAEQRLQQEIAQQKATALKQAAERLEGEIASLAWAGEAYWRRMALIYEQRTEVATRAALSGRLRAIAGLIQFGGYSSPARGGLSTRALAKDLLVAFGSRSSGTKPPASMDSQASQA